MSKRKGRSTAAKVRAFMQKNPKVSVADVAKEYGVTKQYVYGVRWHMNKKTLAEGGVPDVKRTKTYKALERKAKDAKKDADYWNAISTAASRTIEMIEPTPDPVNHPAHYKVGGVETIDFIEAKGLNYHLGNVIKYITRADHKGDRVENLRKAKWYLERELSKVEART